MPLAPRRGWDRNLGKKKLWFEVGKEETSPKSGSQWDPPTPPFLSFETRQNKSLLALNRNQINHEQPKQLCDGPAIAGCAQKSFYKTFSSLLAQRTNWSNKSIPREPSKPKSYSGCIRNVLGASLVKGWIFSIILPPPPADRRVLESDVGKKNPKSVLNIFALWRGLRPF